MRDFFYRTGFTSLMLGGALFIALTVIETLGNNATAGFQSFWWDVFNYFIGWGVLALIIGYFIETND